MPITLKIIYMITSFKVYDLNTTLYCTVSMTKITLHQKTGSMTRMAIDGNAHYVNKSDDGVNDVDDTISSDDVRLDDGCFPAI